MKIILLKDTPKVGKQFDVKDVADGYALNNLIPRGFAEVATRQALKKVDERKAQAEADIQVQNELLEKNFKELDGRIITITEKVNEQGHLFKAIHAAEIVHAVNEQKNIIIDPEMVQLPEAIKEAGQHNIPLVAGNHKATLALTIEAEK